MSITSKTGVLVSTLSCVAALSLVPIDLAAGQAPAQPAEVGQGRQGQPGQPGGRGGGRGGGGRGGMTAAPVPDDMTGFVQIFDGASLKGWEGDLTFWRAEGGAIVGESTPANRVEQNSFLIWRGGTVRDFELKIEVRINGTNSGIQYRSRELPDAGPFVLQGYQADIDFVNQFTGNIHDERGPRFFLSQRGNVVRGVDGGVKKLVGTIDQTEALRGVVNINGWNQYHIIARGSTLLHLVNGRLMAVFLDDDAANRLMDGVIGLQMHTGEPFKVEYRNVWLKQ
ncbi:MAG: DUF1080 domain-containing protein [Acidobacteria bacterium]|nr:DUF1080 domain-containing protein [Acidobacteriota bacterium]